MMVQDRTVHYCFADDLVLVESSNNNAGNDIDNDSDNDNAINDVYVLNYE